MTASPSPAKQTRPPRKRCVDQVLRLHVDDLRPHLPRGAVTGCKLRLHIGDSRPEITLHRRPNAIAWRWYLTCPDCHTLRTALYVPGDDAKLTCRFCANLTYHSIQQRRTTGEKLRRVLKTLMAPAKRRKSS